MEAAEQSQAEEGHCHPATSLSHPGGEGGSGGQGGGYLSSGAGVWGAGNNRTEESLGLGLAQCWRQVETGSRQAALLRPRIPTGPPSEQREGFSSPSASSSTPHPVQQDLAIPYSQAKSGCGWPAGFRPCFPTRFPYEPGHPGAGMSGSVLGLFPLPPHPGSCSGLGSTHLSSKFPFLSAP